MAELRENQEMLFAALGGDPVLGWSGFTAAMQAALLRGLRLFPLAAPASHLRAWLSSNAISLDGPSESARSILEIPGQRLGSMASYEFRGPEATDGDASVEEDVA